MLVVGEFFYIFNLSLLFEIINLTRILSIFVTLKNLHEPEKVLPEEMDEVIKHYK